MTAETPSAVLGRLGRFRSDLESVSTDLASGGAVSATTATRQRLLNEAMELLAYYIGLEGCPTPDAITFEATLLLAARASIIELCHAQVRDAYLRIPPDTPAIYHCYYAPCESVWILSRLGQIALVLPSSDVRLASVVVSTLGAALHRAPDPPLVHPNEREYSVKERKRGRYDDEDTE